MDLGRALRSGRAVVAGPGSEDRGAVSVRPAPRPRGRRARPRSGASPDHSTAHVRRVALAPHRPPPRRPSAGGRRRPRRPRDLLLRRGRRRRVAHPERRRHLGATIRHAADRLHRRARPRALRSERHLRGDGRGVDPLGHHLRRRRLQVLGRRRALARTGTRRHAPHREGAGRSHEPRRRAGRGAGTRVRAQQRARRVPLHRRRAYLDQGPVQGSRHRRHRPGGGSGRSPDRVRRAVPGAPHAVGAVRAERRTGEWPVQVERRRRHLDPPPSPGTDFPRARSVASVSRWGGAATAGCTR